MIRELWKTLDSYYIGFFQLCNCYLTVSLLKRESEYTCLFNPLLISKYLVFLFWKDKKPWNTDFKNVSTLTKILLLTLVEWESQCTERSFRFFFPIIGYTSKQMYKERFSNIGTFYRLHHKKYPSSKHHDQGLLVYRSFSSCFISW